MRGTHPWNHPRGPDLRDVIVPGLLMQIKSKDPVVRERFGRAALSYIYYLVWNDGVPADELEDRAQDAFAKVWKGLPDVESEQALPLWVKTVTLNSLRDYGRKKSRTIPTESLSDYDTPDEQKFAGDGNHSDTDPAGESDDGSTDRGMKIEYGEEGCHDLTVVREEVEKLPPDQREALHYRFWEQLSERQIADKLGVVEGTVESRLSRARQDLMPRIRKRIPRYFLNHTFAGRKDGTGSDKENDND